MFDDNSVFHDRGYKIQFENIGSGKTLANPRTVIASISAS
jgi:hypothetical protein